MNHIFHQSMAPVAQKEYFYQWPYTVFGDTFDEVLILGAGSGTDVAAALRHGAKHVTAVDIDPVILRLGAERHPDQPYSDPRVTIVNDDARHFLRTTTKQLRPGRVRADRFADACNRASRACGSRATCSPQESFEAVRERLSPRGVMVLYNYFREKWLVDRLANTSAAVFGRDPVGHVHQDRAYLAVMLAGPRLAELTAPPPLPPDVLAYGQSHAPSPAQPLVRDPGVVVATDDWPFLYMRAPELPRHYLAALALVLVVSALAVWLAPAAGPRPRSRRRPVVVVALLLPRRRLHAARDEVDRAVRAVVGIDLVVGVAGHRVGAGDGAGQRAGRQPGRDPAPRADRRRAARADRGQLPRFRSAASRSTAGSRSRCSMASLVFSPVFCAGLLFSSSFKESSSTADDFGANLLGAMVGGVGEYLSLLAGYQFLLILVAGCYLIALAARSDQSRRHGRLKV